MYIQQLFIKVKYVVNNYESSGRIFQQFNFLKNCATLFFALVDVKKSKSCTSFTITN